MNLNTERIVEEDTMEVDPQKMLKLCPVKMKPISSFFTFASKKHISSSSDDQTSEKVNSNHSDDSASQNETQNLVKPSLDDKAVEDVEMSYEDFLKDSGLDDVPNNTVAKHGEDLTTRNINSQTDRFTRLKDKTLSEDPQEMIETFNYDGIKVDVKSEAEVTEQVDISEVKCSSQKGCNDTDKDSNSHTEVKATGKASILGYFRRCTTTLVQVEEKSGQVSPEVIITKVDIHTEPLQQNTKKEPGDSISGNMFSIFDSGKRKSGLESKTSPKTNVILHNDDFDMGITVLESPVVENNGTEEEVAMDMEAMNSPEDTEVSDGAEMCSEDTATEVTLSVSGVVKKTVGKTKKTKCDKENSPSVNSGKKIGRKTTAHASPKTPKDDKRKKKQKSPRVPLDSLESSQSDEFTPNSKMIKSGSERKRTIKYCGECTGCLLTDDCGKCGMCLDKTKFGGPNTKKQKCIQRRCERFYRSSKKDQKYDKAKELLQKAKTTKFSPGSPTKLSPKKGKKVPNVINQKSQGTKLASKFSVKPQKCAKNQAVARSTNSAKPATTKRGGSKPNTPTSGTQVKTDPGSSGGGMRSKRRSAQAANKVLVEPSDVRSKKRKL